MAHDRPPEGRRAKHNKPLIPSRVTKSSKVSMTPQVPVSTSIPGPVAGVNIARRVVFQSPTTRQAWAYDMLIAIAAAKALGITQFEVAVDGAPARPQPTGGLFSISYSDAEPWQVSAAATGTCVVTIYAVVVE